MFRSLINILLIILLKNFFVTCFLYLQQLINICKPGCIFKQHKKNGHIINLGVNQYYLKVKSIPGVLYQLRWFMYYFTKANLTKAHI